MTTKPKLPALTSADIEALPLGFHLSPHNGCVVEKWTDAEGISRYSFMSVHEIHDVGGCVDRGGITARLIDPAPLEALLREADGLLNEMRRGAACQPKMDNSCGCKYCRHNKLAKRIEAALEGNDG